MALKLSPISTPPAPARQPDRNETVAAARPVSMPISCAASGFSAIARMARPSRVPRMMAIRPATSTAVAPTISSCATVMRTGPRTYASALTQPGGRRRMSGPIQAASAEYSASTPPRVTMSEESSGACIRRRRVRRAKSSTTASAPDANAAAGSAAQTGQPIRASHNATNAPAEK